MIGDWLGLFESVSRIRAAIAAQNGLGPIFAEINAARATGDEAALGRCVDQLTAKRAGLAPEHARRPHVANLLAKALWVRYQWRRRPEDLRLAYEASGEAARHIGMAAIDSRESPRAMWWTDAAVMAQGMFHVTADVSYLREALRFAERSHKAGDPGGSLRLASLLLDRCEMTDSDEDLERATRLCLDARPGLADDGMASAYVLSTYARALGMQSDHGASIDFVGLYREAAELSVTRADPGHPDTAIARANLAAGLMWTAMTTLDPARYAEAMDHVDAGLRGLPEHDPRWPQLAALRSQILVAGRQIGGAVDGLDPAEAELSRRVVRRARGTAHEPASVITYGLTLAATGDHAGAVSVYREVLQRFGDLPGYRVPARYGLADALYRDTRDAGRRAEALDLMRDLASAADTPASQRLPAALWLADTGARDGDERLTVEGYRAAVALLPALALRRMSRRSQIALLRRLPGIGPEAAAARLALGGDAQEAAGDALALLAAGRGILWGELSRLRTDLGRLRGEHPDLVARLVAIRQALDGPDGVDESAADLLTRRRLAKEWDAIVAEVESRPGFGALFRPANLELPRSSTPIVVINVARRGCTAIVVRDGRADLLPLPSLNQADVQRAVRRLADTAAAYRGARDAMAAYQPVNSTLRWLWDAVVGPVLGHLDIPVPGDGPDPLPVIRWAPTGALASLPLHAALAPDGTTCALDCVVSSYVADLARLREEPGGDVVEVDFVGVPHSPGLPPLRHVTEEYTHIRAAVPGRPWDAPTDTRTALRLLRESGVVHVAAHAGHDATGEPVLHLADGPVAASELARPRTGRGRLAYLAACSTALSVAELPDEAFHIAAAMQVAGYAEVIGTLWPLDDPFAARFAGRFYQALARVRDTARTLNEAQRAARSEQPEAIGRWAAFVHFGSVVREA